MGVFCSAQCSCPHKMGALMSIIQGDPGAADFIFVDFENAQPSSDEERAVYDSVAAVLNEAPTVLEKLRNYDGCEDLIKTAIQEPSPESMDQAWEALLPNIDMLKEHYDYSLKIEEVFPNLLSTLCKNDPHQTIGQLQALTKQLAETFDFVLQFDDMKMVNPGIQNDFSFYRRSRNQRKINKPEVASNIQEEVTNRMSLFYAYPTPMMNSLKETIVKFLTKDEMQGRSLQQNVTTTLAFIANICQRMVEKKLVDNDYDVFCLRCMTASIILYDNIDPKGAFHKRSPIFIKHCLVTLTKKNDTQQVECLLNALRFTTTHLQDAETPGNIRQLLQ